MSQINSFNRNINIYCWNYLLGFRMSIVFEGNRVFLQEMVQFSLGNGKGERCAHGNDLGSKRGQSEHWFRIEGRYCILVGKL